MTAQTEEQTNNDNTTITTTTNENTCEQTCVYGRALVKGWGPSPTKLLIVLDQPGYREVERGRPAVGGVGTMLTQMLGRIGLNKDDCYITYTCACRDFNREDQRALPNELTACRPRLLADVQAAQPGAILVMGALSLQLFFPGTSMSKARGKIRNWQGIPTVASYSPGMAWGGQNPQLQGMIMEDIRLALSLSPTLTS